MSTISQVVNEIHAQMNADRNKHPLQSVNDLLRAKLLECKDNAKTVNEFKALVKKNTGYTAAGIKECNACQYLITKIKAGE